jgi:hypothetical protein
MMVLHVFAARRSAFPDGLAKRLRRRRLGKRVAEDSIQQQVEKVHLQEDDEP